MGVAETATQFVPIEVFGAVHHIDEGLSELLKARPGLSRAKGANGQRFI